MSSLRRSRNTAGSETPYAGQLHSHILQGVVADLDTSLPGVLPAGKSVNTPGYPRFKGRGRFDSFGLKEYGNGFKLDGRRLRREWDREAERCAGIARIQGEDQDHSHPQAGRGMVRLFCL